jgi:hypothetical protein
MTGGLDILAERRPNAAGLRADVSQGAPLSRRSDVARPSGGGTEFRTFMHAAAGGLALLLAGCASAYGPTLTGFAQRSGSGSTFWSLAAWSPGIWLDSGRRNVDDAVRDLQQRADGAWQATVTAADGLTRSAKGRPITSMQACPMAGDVPNCAMAARIACVREGFREGMPVASVRYESCRGFARLTLGATDAGACRTKQRLQSAFCW